MKIFYVLFILLFITTLSFGQVQISEIHYDDSGADSGEGIEILASVTTDLTGWSINLYDSVGTLYYTFNFPNSTIINIGEYLWVSYIGGSNPDYAIKNVSGGVVLLNGSTVVDALWYGTSTPAPSTISYTQLTVSENNSTSNGTSIQLTDSGWIAGISATPGTGPTAGLTLSVVKNEIENFAMYPNPVSNAKLNISSNSWADKHVEIYSISGQKVFSKLVKYKEVLDIYNLNKGIYLVRIEEEGKITTRKLIVN